MCTTSDFWASSGNTVQASHQEHETRTACHQVSSPTRRTRTAVGACTFRRLGCKVARPLSLRQLPREVCMMDLRSQAPRSWISNLRDTYFGDTCLGPGAPITVQKHDTGRSSPDLPCVGPKAHVVSWKFCKHCWRHALRFQSMWAGQLCTRNASQAAFMAGQLNDCGFLEASDGASIHRCQPGNVPFLEASVGATSEPCDRITIIVMQPVMSTRDLQAPFHGSSCKSKRRQSREVGS